ncbi:hypothetical protein ECZU23_41310 [Escherichia coli]|nr:hypothetical protein ECZU20_15140 [Escherichia coli]GHL15688.1 hypothetical protein ECZU23_41310 [Escherichia coli]
MSEKTFLVEIGTEELPPKALRSLAESFAANFTAELDNAGLAHGAVQWFAAPRRLALKVANRRKRNRIVKSKNAARRLLRRSTLKANRAKRQKAGRVVAVLPLTRLSV